MKYCKKILFACIASLLFTSAYADEIDIIVPSKEGGGVFTLSNIVKDAFAVDNITTDLSIKGNCVNGVKRFKETEDPSVMIMTVGDKSGFAALDRCTLTEEEFEKSYTVSLLTAPLALCAKDPNFTVDMLKNGEKHLVAMGVGKVASADVLFDALGAKNIEIVTYHNAKKAVRGLLSGDTQLVWDVAREMPAVQNAGGTCLFVGSDTDLNNIPNMKQVTGVDSDILGNYYFWVLTKNLNTEQKEKVLSSLNKMKQSESFKKFSIKRFHPIVTQDEAAKAQIKSYVLAASAGK